MELLSFPINITCDVCSAVTRHIYNFHRISLIGLPVRYHEGHLLVKRIRFDHTRVSIDTTEDNICNIISLLGYAIGYIH